MTTVTVKVAFRTARQPRADEVAPAPRPRPTPAPIARRLALAHVIEAQIAAGKVADYADAARRLGLTRARVTQLCDLTLLAPDIQAAVLLGFVQPRDRHLRAVGRHALWKDQRRAFAVLFPHVRLTESSYDDDDDRE